MATRESKKTPRKGKSGRTISARESKRKSEAGKKAQSWRLPSKLQDGRKSEITDQQKRFCEVYVESGGDHKRALIEAGYSCPNESTVLAFRKQLMTKSHIVAHIRQLQKDMLTGEIATLSLGVLKSILTDEEINPRIRLDAAKFGIGKAGLDEARFELPNSLETLTLSDLQGMLEQTQDAIISVQSALPAEILDENDVEYQEVSEGA